MDVVVEGKITPEEGMDEVLQTMVDMKSLVHGILRVTCEQTGVNGRIGFAHDGYILGARVNVTNETGYEALRKLLSVTQGNYAVLDAADQQQQSELNQTLWIKAQKIIPVLKNLPETPESLTEANPAVLKANVEKPGGQIDLNVPVEKPAGDNSTKNQVADVKSKARRPDQASLRFLLTLVILATVIFVLTTVVSQYGDTLFKMIVSHK